MAGAAFTPLNLILSFYSFLMDVGVAVCFALILAGYKIKENRFKILTFTFLMAIAGIALHYFPHSLRNLILLALSFVTVKFYFQLPTGKAVLVFFIFILLNFSQALAALVWRYCFGISTAKFMASPIIRILYPLSYNLPLAAFAYASHRRRWRVLTGISRAQISLLKAALPPAAQLVLLGITINELFLGPESNPQNSTRAVVLSLLTAAIILSSFFIWRTLCTAEKEAAAAAQETLAEEMRKQIDAVRAQRHDFINHIQIMLALLKEGRINALTSFVDSLEQEVNRLSAV
ncbi:MAG: Spo0B domain-containing protein [Firmicutes bacterium]|nr:Spo0B domain-containing protein [Bacillota bacterium]